MGNYRSIYRRSLEQPAAFWAEAASALHWDKPWDRVLDAERAPFYSWFKGGRLNTCYNAVDRHVATGRGSQAAIIHDSPVTGSQRTISYAELQDQVARLAGTMVRHGVKVGDRVIVYMPMVPEALVGMLACARIGAVHSVVFGGFAANELATRIDDAKPVLILSASCGVEGARVIPYKPLLDRAIAEAAHKPRHTIILQRPEGRAELIPGRDLDWAEALTAHPVDCVPVEATDPLYILYTSGTTGQPKGVVRDHGGHATALLWTMRNIYGVQPGEVYWAASDVGWVVGHSYICYAPLLNGNTTIVYEGKPVGTPDPGAFWRVVAEHKVSVLFTAPTAFRAIKKEDPEGSFIARYDLSSLAHPVPRRRALRSRHAALGRGTARHPGDRPLVADRDRLGHRRQSHRHRAAAGPPGLAHRADAGLRRADPGRAGRGAGAGEDGGDLHPPADAAGLPAHLVERRRPLPAGLPQPLPRLVPDRRRRLQGRGRLRLHHEPHRRRHQRRRPPAVDRRHGGGAVLAQGRGRVRRDRRRRPAQGRAAAWASSCSRPASTATPRPSARS